MSNAPIRFPWKELTIGIYDYEYAPGRDRFRVQIENIGGKLVMRYEGEECTRPLDPRCDTGVFYPVDRDAEVAVQREEIFNELENSLNNMLQDDSMGNVSLVTLSGKSAPSIQNIKPQELFGEKAKNQLLDSDVDLCIIDGGNPHGDSWMVIFNTRTGEVVTMDDNADIMRFQSTILSPFYPQVRG